MFELCFSTTSMVTLVECQWFVPQEDKLRYTMYPDNSKNDKVYCSKGGMRIKGYYVRNALRCYRCAVSHGYTKETKCIKTTE